MRRSGEHHQAGAAGEADARTNRPGHRGGHPDVLPLRRQAAAELAEVPRPADVEGKIAAGEFVIEVADLGVRGRRGEAAGEDLGIEGQGLPEAGALEVSPAAAIAQQRIALLQGEDQQGLGFIERQQRGIGAWANERLDRRHGLQPVAPGLRGRRLADLVQQVAAIEQQPGVDIPGDAIEAFADPIGGPDPCEAVGRMDDLRGGHGAVQALKRAQGDELGDPGVAHLAEVGKVAAGEGGEQLGMGGGPRQLLDGNRSARMGECGCQGLDHLALAPHGPEPQGGIARRTRRKGPGRKLN